MKEARNLKTHYGEIVQVVDKGEITCSVPDDPQAHIELTVNGRDLWLEVNGTFIHAVLPKGFGVYQK